jgi:hypothetical protein
MYVLPVHCLPRTGLTEPGTNGTNSLWTYGVKTTDVQTTDYPTGVVIAIATPFLPLKAGKGAIGINMQVLAGKARHPNALLCALVIVIVLFSTALLLRCNKDRYCTVQYLCTLYST